MKKVNLKINKRLQLVAFTLLGLIAIIVALTVPEMFATGTGLLMGVPIWGYVADKTFKELSPEDVEKLEIEELVKYLNELNLHKAAKADEMTKQLKKEHSDELEKKLNELRAEINKDNLEQLKAINKAQDIQGLAINKLLKGDMPDKKESFKEKIAKEFENIKKNVGEGGGKHKFIIPNVVQKTTIGLASITDDPMGMFLPDWAVIQSQANRIAPSLTPFTLTPDDHGVIYWTDQTTRTNNAAARSDGSAAAEQVYAWTGYSETVDNISAMVPVHKEALKHISILENEIKMLLNDDIQVALDDYCYTGSGTAPQIGGIYTRATAFDGAAFVAAGGYTPNDANMYDLIVSMAAQIMKSSKYVVDRAWINPYDALKMKLNKDLNGVYTMPPFVIPSANGPITVSGMQIIEANSVTAGTLVVGDSSKARLYSTGAAEIEIGYNLTGDFSKRILTILGNLEVSLLIRNAEVDAFLKSTDINADIAAIQEATA
jgi:hypothetical protein